jgi:hypothetical protein
MARFLAVVVSTPRYDDEKIDNVIGFVSAPTNLYLDISARLLFLRYRTMKPGQEMCARNTATTGFQADALICNNNLSAHVKSIVGCSDVPFGIQN